MCRLLQMNESLVGVTHGWQDGRESQMSNLAMWMTSDWRVCVIYGSQTGGGKKGGWQKVGRGEKICWWLPDWEVEEW